MLQNLIRNAYQHCNEGVIEISQSQSNITIRNTLCDDGESNDVSFGLGLKL
ncbi:HAMP domain-containing histidine kinase [Shewanella sp. 202IG2-18]|uniref:HAMP domain-containing histidine kinase n=1 Tax=Parashewanella hymeniacidonis TaxID=2807618 RepID=UPI00195FDBDE|nr:HAMP domain-containing histidine kinase [Parashewanella hymeniacidonis]MBM7071870.1 HAMP domain-containing histidine kinase [Parashewanella hymeniacidonis]